MTSTGDRPLVKTGEQSLSGRYRLFLVLAWAVVLWERLWARFWKPVLVAAVFVASVLLDLLPGLPDWLHAAVLAGFVVAFGLLSYQAWRGFQAVDTAAARRRLEQDSGLSHRPLSSLTDQPVSTNDHLSMKIWLAHVRRLIEDADSLTLRPPSPGMAARDPYAIRAVVLLALFVGLVAGYGDAGPRLARALTIGGGTDDRFSVEVWLNPPAYSGQSPIFLNNENLTDGTQKANLIDIPAGSTLTAHIAGRSSWYAPEPVLEIGEQVFPFAAIGAVGDDERESFHVETVLEDADEKKVSVRANGTMVASWTLAVVPDLPPTAEMTGPPKPISRSRLQLAYQASDDYAVDTLALELRLQDRALLAGNQVRTLNLPVGGMPFSRRHIERQSRHDLTTHPWAGLAVELRLLARDEVGQEGVSEWTQVTLPERKFNNPAARAIISQRRRLALLEPKSHQKIEQDIIVGLEQIKDKPDSYEADIVVFLSLGVAQARLLHSQDDSRYDSVMELLWNTAIRLEEGRLAVAERELEKAREDLRDALQEGASPADIDRLMDRTQQALNNYLSALAEQMQAGDGAQMELEPMLRMLGANDLRGLLDKVHQLARTGATDAARQMLSELDRILESVQGAMQGGSAMRAMNKKLKQYAEMLNQARRLEKEQQDLLDDTFGAINTKAHKTPEQSALAATAQRALRQDLGRLMLEADSLLGAIPPPFGQADHDMMEAAEALGKGRLPEALGRQTGAMENLRRGLEEISAEMAKMMAGAYGLSLGDGPGGLSPGGRDPFGRTTGQGGLGPGGTVGIPERGEVQRSRQILDELRRRAGQHQRPKPERDYIDRLLRKF